MCGGLNNQIEKMASCQSVLIRTVMRIQFIYELDFFDFDFSVVLPKI